MNYAEFEAQDRRLVLLCALQHAALYKANAHLLLRYCEAIGHTVTATQLQADLDWLLLKSLLTLQSVQGVTVATLTALGLNVATGRDEVPGVARPQPGA